MENSVVRGAKIVVIGVGGGGCNALNSMIESKIDTAEYIAVNTDAQALAACLAPTKITLGETLTRGLGAGAQPDVGQAAAEESREEIRKHLVDVDLLFITAGMGGGTGTGAAPIIASMAREKNILTVAVVTKPFSFEGTVRMENAEAGIKNLSQYVDTLIVVPNDNLIKMSGEKATWLGAFKLADSMLRDAVRGISGVIKNPTMINLDFNDIKTVMKDRGFAHLSIGEAEGPNKIVTAIEHAVMSDLLETNIKGASNVILYITGGTGLSIAEVNKACVLVRGIVSEKANIIFGGGIDANYGDKVQVVIVATGFNNNSQTKRTLFQNSMGREGMISNDELKERLKNNFPFMNSANSSMYPYPPQKDSYVMPQTAPQPQPQAPQQEQFTPYQPQQTFTPKEPVQQEFVSKPQPQPQAPVARPWLAKMKSRNNQDN